MKMKGKVIFGSHVNDVCDQIEKLTESLIKIMSVNEKVISELAIVKNVNVNLKSRIVNLKKLL